LNVAVRVAIRSLSGVRLTEEIRSGELINFDVKAKLEEKERRSGWLNIGFALSVGTKPSVVKFEVEGTASLEGKDANISKMLEVDPETQIPVVFQRVYQHVFMSMYLLATLLDTPYPPPNLLFSDHQQTPMVQMTGIAPTPREEVASQPSEQTGPPQEGVASPRTEQTVKTTTEVQESSVAQSETRAVPRET
jgi:hypothetical protein